MEPIVAGVDITASKFVLTKFLFTNTAHVPEFARRLRRKDQGDLVKKLMDGLKAEAPEQVQGVRVVDNAPSTSAEDLFNGLRQAGLVIVDVQNWTQQKPGRPPKEAVLLVWGRPQEGVEGIEVDASALTQDVVWFCHMWQNPTRVNTADFVGRQPGQRAKNRAVVEDGQMTVRPV